MPAAPFKAEGWGVNSRGHTLTWLPSIATIVVLAVISRDATVIRLNAPASLGKSFHPYG